MSRRVAVQLAFLACAWSWGCSRDRDREVIARDTVSLAPLADSAASQSLGDSAHQSRAGARPGRLAERATATRADSARRGGTEHRRIGPPARKRAAPAGSDSAVHGYAPATDSTAAPAADTAAATQHHVAAMPTPDSAVERAPSDTSAVGRAAVGDSIIPTATPVVPAPDSAPREPRDSPASPDQTDSSPSATPVPVGATASPDASGSPRAADSGGATDSAAAAESPGATQSPGTTESASQAHVARNALPVGTQIRAILDDSITSLRNSVGQRVSAVVSGDLRAADGLAVLPSGSVVHLTIDRLAPARTRSAKDGELVLRADSIVAGGHAYPIDAALQAIPHELRGRGVTAGEVEKVGAGAAAGAVVGGVVTGKTKGAVVGGAVGAVGGAVVAAQTASRDVVVAPRTLITLVLRSPVVRVVP